MPPKRPASQEAGSPRPPPRHLDAPPMAGPLPLRTIYQDVRIEFTRRNILTFPAAAIVNAANATLRGGGGLDGQFHYAAGPAMLAELVRTYPIGGRTGRVYVTSPYDIQSAQYVFHAVGPDYRTADTVEEREQAERLLRYLYDEILTCALERGARSLAIPTISTGIFEFPRDRAAEIALKAVTTFMDILATSRGGASEHFDQISFLLWPPGNEDEDAYRKLFPIFFGHRAHRRADSEGTPKRENSESQDTHSSDEGQDKNYDVNSPVDVKNEDGSGDVQPPPDVFKGESDSGDVQPSPGNVKDEASSQDEDEIKSESGSQDGSDSQVGSDSQGGSGSEGSGSPDRAGSQRPPGSPNTPPQEPNSSSSSSSNDGSDNDLFILGPNSRVPLSHTSSSNHSASPTPSSHSADVEEDDDDDAPATCAGITKKGERCKRLPKNGELYCHSHMAQE